MSFLFVAATPSQLLITAPVITTAPLTMLCFFKPVASGIRYAFICADDGTISNRFLLASTTANHAQVTATASGTGVSTNATEPYFFNQWQSVGFVSTSSTFRYIATNGHPGTQDTTSIVPTGISQVIIGNRTPSGSFPMDGLIAEVAIWSAALTPGELMDYHAGIQAPLIRPNALQLYMPLRVNTYTADFGPYQYAVANTAAVPNSDHPSILPPVKRRGLLRPTRA